MKRKPKVGDILVSVNVGNAARYRPQIATPVKVTKIGRKYFTTIPVMFENKGWMAKQYYIDDWTEKSKYSACSVLYESEQEWNDFKLKKQYIKDISKYFDYTSTAMILSIDQLKQIKEWLKSK